MPAMKYFFILLLAGCAAAPSGSTGSATATDSANAASVNPAKATSDAALTAYEKFIKLFSEGKVTEADDFFDRTMIGRQEMTDSLNNSKISQKNISFEEQNLKIQALGDTAVVINSSWKKRYINTGGTQITKRGDTKFFMQKSGSDWKLVGMTGENILLP